MSKCITRERVPLEDTNSNDNNNKHQDPFLLPKRAAIQNSKKDTAINGYIPTQKAKKRSK
jgi:hypothetical protein